MRFGVNILSRGPMATREGYLGVAEAAERLGFDFVSVNDHVVVPADIASRYPYSEGGEWAPANVGECLEQLSTLSFLAGCTKRLKLLTSVMVVPHRQVILAAKMLATADVLSGGRVIVGCGAGWMKEEFEALDAPPFEERGRVTDEYLAAFKELWTKDTPQFHGKHVDFDPVLFRPKPVQKPHPPLWIGGESEPAMKRAIKLGDGWYPASSNPANRLDTPERVAGAVTKFKALAQTMGRDPATIHLAHVVLWPVNTTAEAALSGGRRTMTGSVADLKADVAALEVAGIQDLCLSFHAPYIGGIVERMEQFAASMIGNG
ncbi:MAG: LLM class F420-dependent oxidoreductase [Hyphomicrobiaceae bacterium]